MTYEEKARALLESLGEVLQVNWAMEKVYVRALVKGLRRIDELEQGGTGVVRGCAPDQGC